MIAWILKRVGRAQWVTVETILPTTGYVDKELAFRIFGVNFLMYKDHVPLAQTGAHQWRRINKREYGEAIRPTR